MESLVTLIVLVLAGWGAWWATGVFFPDPTHHWAAILLLILFGGFKIGGKD